MIKLGAEFILGTIFLPWMVVLTYGMFNSHEANAVQETKYQVIIEKLDTLAKKVDAIKR